MDGAPRVEFPRESELLLIELDLKDGLPRDLLCAHVRTARNPIDDRLDFRSELGDDLTQRMPDMF